MPPALASLKSMDRHADVVRLVRAPAVVKLLCPCENTVNNVLPQPRRHPVMARHWERVAWQHKMKSIVNVGISRLVVA